MIPTPDGVRYLHLGAGEQVPRPFYLRWLVPTLCRQSHVRWLASAWGSWIVATICVGLLAPTWQTGIAAALMFCWLPGIRYNLGAPILVDMPAMAWALVAAVLAKHGQVELAIMCAGISGACKESGPLLAAVFAWNPWLLVGLLAPLVRLATAKPGPDPLALPMWNSPGTSKAEHAWILAHPWRTGLKYHKRKWLDGAWMVAPWGGVLVAVTNPSIQLAACVAICYAQLLVASDTVRLYQWAAPVACVAAATAVPPAWLPLLVLVTVWNPLAGDGV